MSVCYPLKLKPFLSERVWGGSGLSRFYSEKEAAGRPIGEVWTLCGSQPVVNGVHKGVSLDSLCAEFSELLPLGSDPAAGFPLLIKWLRAEQWLSVQVHPDDALASELSGIPGTRGKTEAWYVTEKVPGSELILGAAEGSSPEKIRSAEGADILPLLKRVSPECGSCLCINPGTIHALGPGITVLEVQQNSQITYRLYDWDRLGLDGKPRQLHKEEAAAAVSRGWKNNLAQNGASEVFTEGVQFPELLGRPLVSCAYFRMEIINGVTELCWNTPGSCPDIIIALSSGVNIELDGCAEELCEGESCVLAGGGRRAVLRLADGACAVRAAMPVC